MDIRFIKLKLLYLLFSLCCYNNCTLTPPGLLLYCYVEAKTIKILHQVFPNIAAASKGSGH